MKSTQDEFTNETQPFSWIGVAVSWKIAADAVLTKIQQKGNVKVAIKFGDSLMATTRTTSQAELLGPVYMTMAGFAVENLIKGILIRDNPKLIHGKSGSLNKKGILKHSLIELAKEMGFIDEEDNEKTRILERLSDFVVWAGRYPVPRVSSQYQKVEVDLEPEPEQVNRIFDELVNSCASKGVIHIVPRLNWGDFVDNSK